MRKIFVDGNLARDAEVLQSKNGVKYTRLSIANRVFKNGKEETDWFRVISYDPMVADSRSKYMTKGSLVEVFGDYEERVENGKTYRDVKADFIEIRMSKKSEGNVQATPEVEELSKQITLPEENDVQVKMPEVKIKTKKAEPVPVVSAAADDDLPF